MTGHIKRLSLVFLAAVWLGACGLFQGNLFKDSFWASSPLKQNDEAELGIAEMAKGNYVTAEGHFKKALTVNPKDVHALLGSGILYQNTGQLTKAREMYEAVLAIRPDESQQFVTWSNISTRPASQVASVNLSLLDSGGVASAMAPAGVPTAGVAPMGAAPMSQAAPPVSAAPSSAAMLGRPTAMPLATQQAMAMPSPSSMSKITGADANVVSRFATIRALRDQGLVTEQEFHGRRRANLGALLPLTAPPPAAGLDRPVPSTEQISGRLRAIGRALEMRAISVAQHSAERSMILDALMPAAPVVVANPGAPPQGLLEAADSVRRLEQLKEGAFITSDEYAKERQAVEMAMQPAPPPKPTPVATAPKPLAAADAKSEAKPTSTGPRPGVHLASYRSQQQAERGWTQIQKAHKALLEGLEHEVVKVNLGRKGIYYRLKAGPLDSQNAAKEMCGKLKARRQFCEPTVLEEGG
ncbi:MAG TPA: tetratricopeptide repeat protein [Kiloniellales bacterium]